jgi:hypothetical protein
MTVIDGEFPRDVLQKEDLTFDEWSMPAERNRPEVYTANEGGPPLYRPGVRIIEGEPPPPALPKPTGAGIVLAIGVVFVGLMLVRPVRRKAAGAALLFACCIASPLAAADEPDGWKSALADLSKPAVAADAVEKIKLQGSKAIPDLAAVALGKGPVSGRGWAIVALAEIGGRDADAALAKIGKESDTPLVAEWAAAGRIIVTQDPERLIDATLPGAKHPALARTADERLGALIRGAKTLDEAKYWLARGEMHPTEEWCVRHRHEMQAAVQRFDASLHNQRDRDDWMTKNIWLFKDGDYPATWLGADRQAGVRTIVSLLLKTENRNDCGSLRDWLVNLKEPAAVAEAMKLSLKTDAAHDKWYRKAAWLFPSGVPPAEYLPGPIHATVRRIVALMLHHEDSSVRGTARIWLNEIPAPDEVATALEAALAFSPTAGAVPWRGDFVPIFPSGDWSSEHRRRLSRLLIQWSIWLEKNEDNGRAVTLLTRLESRGWGDPSWTKSYWWVAPTDEWYVLWGNTFGRRELEALFAEQGVASEPRYKKVCAELKK